jgi:phage tail-like protein
MDEARMLTPFNFAVEIDLSGFGGDEGLRRARGAFAEVQGLEMTLEAVAFREGGYNQGPRQLIGKATTQPLVLKRGLTLDTAFWDWLQRCTSGTFPLPYVSGTVRLFSPRGSSGPEGRWRFVNGIATKVSCASLNARAASEVALEELQLVHEGLSRELP